VCGLVNAKHMNRMARERIYYSNQRERGTDKSKIVDDNTK